MCLLNIKPEHVNEIMNFAYGKPSKIIESKFFALMRLFETKGIEFVSETYNGFKVIELSNGLMVAVKRDVFKNGCSKVQTLILEPNK